MQTLAVAVVLALPGMSLLAPDEPRTYEGTWTNRLYNSSGALKCVATPGADGTWQATFSGKFMGRPFRYDVTFQSKRDGDREALSGDATIKGYKYRWTGTLEGGTLTGRYRANNGYNGEFTLKEAGK